MIKPYKTIATVYRGFAFRSRFEARWAVYMDAMGVKWQYEPEGFELPSGRYLPDFYLPDFDCYVEVKSKWPTEEEFRKCRELVEATRSKCLILDGDPAFRHYNMYELDYESKYEHPDKPPKVSGCSVTFNDCAKEGRWFWVDGWMDSADEANSLYPSSYMEYLTEKTKNAIHAARQARFEYGETPGEVI